jgi:hypothetical protein
MYGQRHSFDASKSAKPSLKGANIGLIALQQIADLLNHLIGPSE